MVSGRREKSKKGCTWSGRTNNPLRGPEPPAGSLDVDRRLFRDGGRSDAAPLLELSGACNWALAEGGASVLLERVVETDGVSLK